MKQLISFSLKRRFMNSAAILLNILLCILASGVLFADKIIEIFNPSFLDDQVIILDVDETIEHALLSMEQEGILFEVSHSDYKELLKEKPKAYVLTYDEGYKIASQYAMNSEIINGIKSLLSNVHQTLLLSETLSIEDFERVNQELTVENIVLEEHVQMDNDKQNVVFMLITSIYFTMLSFSTSIANEVVYEKSTRQLELILTSVDAKTHFLSKMIVGWLAILIQSMSVVFYVGVATLMRNCFDEGKGFIELVNQLKLIHIQENTFFEFLSHLQIESDFIIKLFFILFFLMMGILLLQMVMVVISSFIANIEEAGNVQGPFYMLLLGLYYFALSLNTPYQMSEGLGYVLSFFPFLNMLFMPCRLIIQDVSIFEMLLSAMVSCVFMIIVIMNGSKIYQRGVLDYTSKGFLGVIKKTFAFRNDSV